MQKNIETNVIRKVRKEKEFAQISNDLINNRELSYKALGMLTYILSKPDDWQVYMSDLVRDGIEGEKSVRNGLNELIEKNYVQRYRVYNKDTGKVHHWETLVSEIPFPEEELISSVKETYALNKDGQIAYQKFTLGDYVRYIPIVMEREVTLLSQKGNVEKNNNKITTLPKGTSRKPTSRKRRTTNTNITNTNNTNTDISSSSKGETLDSIHPLVELFNASICELKKTTTVKFMKYIEKYDKEFIVAIISYCEERNAKSYSYFAKTIERYIGDGITTVEDMNKSIEQFKDKNKTKKNKALKDKDEKKQEEAFEESINERIMEDLAGGCEIEVPVEINGEDINEKIKSIIATKLTEVSFNTWIKMLDIRLENDTVVAGCPNAFTKDIVDKRYYHFIAEAIAQSGLDKKLKTVVVAN